jgi:3-keto-disaccharide hydrolase
MRRSETMKMRVARGGNLFTEKEYPNFVFRFEFKTEPGGNNGVGIRAPLEGDAAYAGMEIQILDDGHERYKGKIKSEQHHGSIYDVIPARENRSLVWRFGSGSKTSDWRQNA